MLFIRLVAALAILAAGLSGQSRAAAFEVASINESSEAARGLGCGGGPGTSSPGQWFCHGATLTDLILMAYSVRPEAAVIPGSMRLKRFDVVAKLPANTSHDQFLAMQQNLLKERFDLRLHKDERVEEVYELTVPASGSKIRRSPPESALRPEQQKDGEDQEKDWMEKVKQTVIDSEGFPIPPKGNPGFMVINGHAAINGTNWTLDQLTRFFTSQVQRRVVNATHLIGSYHIHMHWIQDWLFVSKPEVANGPTLVRAIQEQLGLKVEAKKTKVPVLVIDGANRMPIPN